jgi:nitrile hydratase
MSREHDHDLALRAEALEASLTEKGLVQPALVDAIVRRYEQDIGPMNGARAVARAWIDPAFKTRLLADAWKAIAELGVATGPDRTPIVVLENTPAVHNVVVCTLCSCYPSSVLGLPPTWYKSPPYRSRVVREPRVVLGEMGSRSPHVRCACGSSAGTSWCCRAAGRTDGWSGAAQSLVATR